MPKKFLTAQSATFKVLPADTGIAKATDDPMGVKGLNPFHDLMAGFVKVDAEGNPYTVGVLPDTVSILGSDTILIAEDPSDTFTFSIPTTATPQFAGLGIGTPGEADKLSFLNGALFVPAPNFFQFGTEADDPAVGITASSDAATAGFGVGFSTLLSNKLQFRFGSISEEDGTNDLVLDSSSDNVRVEQITVALDAIITGSVSASGGYIANGETGIDTTITTGSLVGKTITITKGIITGFA